MDELIQEQFKEIYKNFAYPFKTSDQLISKMPENKRLKYLREAGKINSSDVLIQELNEICRHLYYQLAVESKTDGERNLYRGALLFASIFKKRFNQLANLDPIEIEKSIEIANKRIDEIIT